VHKGFPLYNIMAPLMPSLATGTNVYRPSEGTCGAASATLLHGANAGTADSNRPSGLRDQELAVEPPHP
jgi:hypothetical protein